MSSYLPTSDKSDPTSPTVPPWWKRVALPSKRFYVWFLILTVLFFGGTCVIGFMKLSKVRDLSERMTPQEAFEWLGCKPMPPSIQNLQAHGGFALAGSSVTIKCAIAPADFDFLVKQGGFVLMPDPGVAINQQHYFPESTFYRKRTATFTTEDDGFEGVTPEVSKEHDRIILHYWHS